MWRVCWGAVAEIVGIVALVEGRNHRPEYECKGAVSACEHGEGLHLLPGHLTETPYDLLLVGAWALVILGGLTVVLGLIRYRRT